MSTLNNDSTIKTSQIEPFRNSLFSYTNILAGSGENWKKRGGSNFFQLVPMLKNEKFFFLFSMMWLYPVLFSINSRLQKCNFFSCTPRMNNSRLRRQSLCTNVCALIYRVIFVFNWYVCYLKVVHCFEKFHMILTRTRKKHCPFK